MRKQKSPELTTRAQTIHRYLHEGNLASAGIYVVLLDLDYLKNLHVVYASESACFFANSV